MKIGNWTYISWFNSISQMNGVRIFQLILNLHLRFNFDSTIRLWHPYSISWIYSVTYSQLNMISGQNVDSCYENHFGYGSKERHGKRDRLFDMRVENRYVWLRCKEWMSHFVYKRHPSMYINHLYSQQTIANANNLYVGRLPKMRWLFTYSSIWWGYISRDQQLKTLHYIEQMQKIVLYTEYHIIQFKQWAAPATRTLNRDWILHFRSKLM